MANKPHEPTPALRGQVETMTGYGIKAEDIARSLGICHVTLRKYYRDELDLGTIKANAKVAESLFKKATSDGSQSVTAAIWWSKTRMGWKETVVNEHGGTDGGPVTVQVVTGVPSAG
jgi:hypothetical protein